MQHLITFLESFYNYIYTLIGIDFTGYSGELPNGLIEMYSYVEKFYQLVIIFFFVYLIYNFIYFVITIGGVRRKWTY